MNGQDQTIESNKKKKQTVILAIIVIILAIALVVAVLLLLRKGEKDEERRNVVVTEENAEEIAAQMAEADYVEPGYYTVNMTREWHFSKGNEISDNARVDNLPENTNPVYLGSVDDRPGDAKRVCLDVVLGGDETEPVYSSPIIPVGSYLEKISLDQPLGAGEYDCVAVYHLVDDEQNTISTLRIKIKLVVES